MKGQSQRPAAQLGCCPTVDGGRTDESPLRARLANQIAWYEAKSQRISAVQGAKGVCRIVIAAAIPAEAGTGWSWIEKANEQP